jgi:2-polyprenyl-3-methyl-5-hydroxy-6-metoxy-1,4-benzoquinol methylase
MKHLKRFLLILNKIFTNEIYNNSKSTGPDDPLTRIINKIPEYEKKIKEIKKSVSFEDKNLFWYPYSTLSTLYELDTVLTKNNRDIFSLSQNMPIADIGAADGDLAFFLENLGFSNVHIIDNGPTNCNRLKGAYILKKEINSCVTIHDINLDEDFNLPSQKFGLIFMLGTLYHLKNPFFVLEKLAKYSKWLLLGTRTMRKLFNVKKDLSTFPIAYLLNSYECNNDSTNYWVFTNEGLKRLLLRSGWDIYDFGFCGYKNSTPTTMNKMQKTYCLAKSRLFKE